MSERSRLKDRIFINVALDIGLLGTCDRKRVGALIVREGRCVTWGFNGAPPGLPHCNENYHGWVPERMTEEETPEEHRAYIYQNLQDHGCRNATHAEANALAFAARQGISTDGGTLYVGVSPCDVCARLLIAAGIRRVVYREEYRDRSGIELLERAGVAFLHDR